MSRNITVANKKVVVGTEDKVQKSWIYRRIGDQNEEALSTGARVPPYKGDTPKLVLIRQAKHAKK